MYFDTKSLATPPPDVLAASKAVPLTVNIFMLSLHLQVITALPENKNNNSHRVIIVQSNSICFKDDNNFR